MARLRTRKRGNTWSYNFDAKTLDGKRKIIEKGGFLTKKEALDAGTLAYASYKKGNIGIVTEKISCKDYFGKWLEVKEKEVKATSFDAISGRIKKLIPYMGNIKLQSLRPRDVDNIISALTDEGYSHNTLTGILTTLKNALDYAVYPCELRMDNPARLIKVPKRAPKEIIKRQVIGREKLNELLTAYPFGHQFYMPIIIAYHTGMRLGEVLGLCWDAVDFEKKKISVIRQLSVTNKGVYFNTPKTKTSVREILMDSQLVSILKEWKKAQAQNELTQGASYLHAYEDEYRGLWQLSKNQDPPEGFTPRQLICVNKRGKAVSRKSVIKAFRDRGLTFHSLRHTHTTMLIESGAIPKDVAARLGHTDATITQNLYTHDTEEMQKNTVELFENLIL